MSFWGELRRRNVVRVGAAYAVAAWLLAQIVTVINEPLGLPDWFDTAVIVLLAVGLPIALLFAWVFEVTPDGLRKTQDTASDERGEPAASRRLDYAVTALLGIAIVFLVVDNYVLPRDAPSSVAAPREAPSSDAATGAATAGAGAVPAGGAAAAGAVPAGAVPAGAVPAGAVPASAVPAGAAAAAAPLRDVLPNSVAVLPFQNMSPNESDAYFALGIHEEILNALAQLRALNVIARTSVMQYAATQKTATQIAEELNVETIMEGSVRYDRDRVRVTTQLIDARTGAHLWSNAYERQLADIFAIQADIARNVAAALEAEFSIEERRTIETVPTSSSEAYALYLQALNRLGTSTEQDQLHALLDSALEMDPNFALALGAKASAYGGQLINTGGTQARNTGELEPLIRQYAARALELDPRNGYAHAALGNLDILTWHWTDARGSVLRALESPQFPAVVANWFLCWSGNVDEAVAFAQRNERLNPIDWVGPWNLGMVLNYARRYDEAAAALRKSIGMSPALPIQRSWLAWTEIARGNREVALQELELTEQLLGDSRLVLYLIDLAYSYGRLGDGDNAQRLFAEIEAVAAAGADLGAGGWALANLAIGNRAEALRWLSLGADKARRHEIDAGMFSLMNVKLNVTRDPVLEQPEFVDVRNRLIGD